MYRFRSVENLIGEYQELEKQQIYFAAREQLNDPMEGRLRYFLQGDKIVWDNFLKHYLLCLQDVIFLSLIRPDDKPITKKDIPIFISEKDLHTDIYRKHMQEIHKHFFSDGFVKSYLKFIVKNPNKIYFEEMYVHLKMLNGKALEIIFDISIQNGFISNLGNYQPKREEKEFNLDLSNVWDESSEKAISNIGYRELMEYLCGILKGRDIESLLRYKDSPKLQSINIEFPQMYLDSIIGLIYPEAYVACFMDDCLNSSIWGTYGYNHTGVCLKFKTNSESNPILPLKTIVGYGTGGNIYDYRDFELKQIEYSNDFEELDFFRNLGRLTLPQLKEQWYTDGNGELSVCHEDIFLQRDEWRNHHWNIYKEAYLKKIPDWSQEREYRIILSSALDTFDEPKDRLLEYKFENLEAIIFGMKTPKEAKIEIIEIIKRKFEESGRKQFDFFEMMNFNNRNELYPLKILSLSK